MNRQFSTTTKLILSVLIFIFFVGLLEIALRLGRVDTFVENRYFVLNRALDYPEVFIKDKVLFWRLKPSQAIKSKFFSDKKIKINSLGLRGEEVNPDKKKKRIIALGNSCTFGWGASVQTIFAAQIGRRLGQSWESINAGVPGYSSFQGKHFLQSDIISLKPEILLIMFGWNDHWAAASQIADKDQQFPTQPIIDLQNFLSNLHGYRLLKKTWVNLIDPNPDSTFDRDQIVYRVGPQDFQKNITEICRLAQTNNIIPVLMTSPIPSLEKYYPRGMSSPMHRIHKQYNDITRNVALKNKVLLIDLDLEFNKAEYLWDDAANDPIHFNSRGHSLATMTIAAKLKQAGILDTK